MEEVIFREAEFYSKETGGTVRCQLCPHFCILKPGQTGLCRSRNNQDGILVATNYGKSIGGHADVIEKKPLYHFRPGSTIYSLGPNSCNLSCDFCQNYEISQLESPYSMISPQQLYDLLKSNQLKQVAFTYTEPLTWYEFILDFAILAKGIDIVLVSNGHINPEPLRRLLPYISAMNIDLKSIREAFYRKRCGGGLQPVLKTIRTVHAAGIHLELTNLIIPGANDSPEDIQALVDFCFELGPDIPLHFSVYHPAYKSRENGTPVQTVINACKSARAKLNYVYAGNTRGSGFEDTLCPECDSMLIHRGGMQVVSTIKADGSCPVCAKRIYGVFD